MSLVTPLAAPASVAEHHGLSLNDLSQVDVSLRMLVFKISLLRGDRSYLEVSGCSEVLHQVSSQSPLMPVGLVVEVDHMRLWEKILWILDEVFNGGQVWESLHAKFAVEPAAEGIEDLILFLCTVPYCTSLGWSDN